MGTKASQITSLTIVYSTVYSDADQRKHQSSASLAFVRGIHRWPVNSPQKWPVTRKLFLFDDVIMLQTSWGCLCPRAFVENTGWTRCDGPSGIWSFEPLRSSMTVRFVWANLNKLGGKFNTTGNIFFLYIAYIYSVNVLFLPEELMWTYIHMYIYIYMFVNSVKNNGQIYAVIDYNCVDGDVVILKMRLVE